MLQPAQQQRLGALAGSGATSQLSSPYNNASNAQIDHAGTDSGSRSSDDNDDTGQGAKNKHNSKRTPKQQLQNKQAQQRYRQRRKQKLVEMESALELLNQKVQDMQSLQTQNYYLAGRAAKLEQALKAKEGEISKLRQLISQQHVSSLSNSPGPSKAPLDSEQMKKTFVESVDALKEFVTICDLRNVDASGAGVAEDVIVRCKGLVAAASKQCMDAMSADNPAVLNVISRDPGRLSVADNQADRSRWLQVVEVLRLTEDQVDCILQGAEALLPAGSSDGLAAQLQHLHLNGFLYTAKDSIRVSEALDTLKENLRTEQRSLQDMNYMITLNILSPIQAALLFVDAFPFHCDTLALSNALASSRGTPPTPIHTPSPPPPDDTHMSDRSPPPPRPPLVRTASSSITNPHPYHQPQPPSSSPRTHPYPQPQPPPLDSPRNHLYPPPLTLSLNQHSPTVSGMDTTSPTGAMPPPPPLPSAPPRHLLHTTRGPSAAPGSHRLILSDHHQAGGLAHR